MQNFWPSYQKQNAMGHLVHMAMYFLLRYSNDTLVSNIDSALNHSAANSLVLMIPFG